MTILDSAQITTKSTFLLRITGICRQLAAAEPLLNATVTSLSDQDLSEIHFGKALVPVVMDAVQRVRQIYPAYAQKPAAVRAASERYLLQRLSQQAAYSLYFQFSLARALRRHSIFMSSDGSTALYDEFVAGMLSGGLVAFLEEYQELARCLERVCNLWLTNTPELFERLTVDRHLLERFVSNGQTMGDLSDLQLSLSEPHNLGRSVARLQFEGGQVVYYKPRDCSSDVNYYELVTWLAERGANLRAARVLNRNGYGWFEAVEKTDCRSQDQVRRHYENSGALMCFLYALRAADNHCENIMSSGQFPVLIDTECLMHPDNEDIFPNAAARADAPTRFMSTVSSTMVIPALVSLDVPNPMGDLSALGCVDATKIKPPFELPVLLNGNTDAMTLDVPAQSDLKGMIHLNSQVVFQGAVQDYREYSEEIRRGFTAMYQLLLQEKEALLQPGSPLNAFADQYVRPVARGTVVYAILLLLSSRSNLMRDSAARRQYLQNFLTELTGPDAEQMSGMIAAEVASMCDDLDVPYFSVHASSKEERNSAFNLPSSCYALAKERIAALCREDLQKQLDHIDLVLKQQAKAS